MPASAVCAFTSICEEDAERWGDQYLAESARLDLPFAIHFDRCSEATKERFKGDDADTLCIGWTQNDDPNDEFTEQDKQGALDTCEELGFIWALAWDADETWEEGARAVLQQLDGLDYWNVDYVTGRWLNLWGDRDHVRIDGPFANPKRVKLYRLDTGIRWRFAHPITNGAKHSVGDREPQIGHIELACLHHGMMTRELREQHKARWDRIYTAAVGANPYHFWEFALDEAAYPPTIVPYPFLPGTGTEISQ